MLTRRSFSETRQQPPGSGAETRIDQLIIAPGFESAIEPSGLLRPASCWKTSARALAAFALLASTCWGQGAGKACAQEAPWGLAWGPVKDVPRPSFAQRESNITALIYLHDRVPPNLRDTDEIVLEVCAVEGLQHVIWVSRRLSGADAAAKYARVVAEGTRRYGTPDESTNGVAWPTGRTAVTLTPEEGDTRRVIMTSAGPAFDSCSKTHADLTGHSALDHITELLARP